MLDFKLDGGMSSQVFEGTDYSAKARQADEQKGSIMGLTGLTGIFIDPGKRERKTVQSYSDSMTRMIEEAATDKRPKMPRHLRLPRMEDWQFYNRTRLNELQEMEVTRFDKLVEEGLQLQSGKVSEFVILEPELHAEKQALLADGFSEWSKVIFNNFLRACAKLGRNELHRISKEIGRPLDEVKRFADKFWSEGEKTFTPQDWERFTKQIDKGEKKSQEISRLTDATEQLIRQFEDPWEELVFRHVGNHGRIFSPLEDRYLLCLTQLHGYGAWDRVRDSIRRCDKFRFDYFLQSCSVETLGKRCETLMRAAERELNEMEKKKTPDAAGFTTPLSTTSTSSSALVHEQNIKKVSVLRAQITAEARKLAATKLELKTGKVPTAAAVTRSLKAIDKVAGKAGDALGDAAGATGQPAAKLANPNPIDTANGSTNGSAPHKTPSPATKAPSVPKEKKSSFPEDLLPALYGHLSKLPYQQSLPALVKEFTTAHPSATKVSTEAKIKDVADKRKASEVGMEGGKLVWCLKAEFGGASNLTAGTGAQKAPAPKRKVMSSPTAASGTAAGEGASGGDENAGPAAKKAKKGMSAFAVFRKDVKAEVEAFFKDESDGDVKRAGMKNKYQEMWTAAPPDVVARCEERARRIDAAREKKEAALSSPKAASSGAPTPVAAVAAAAPEAVAFPSV